MSDTLDRLLRLRAEMNRKRPMFLRHLWWKKAKFRNDPKWRKPKGIDNKMKHQLKGYPPIVKVGYRGPSMVRGLHPSGLEPVVVNSTGELDGLDPARHIVYIGSRVGLRKSIEIYKLATGKGFKVANPPRTTQSQQGA
ncbi:50S ribosomal protein L32e [Desulfurococcus mucosus]|uniref:Large ribosomal subunit protein eL32 n=1 Tax=Desulfurococcus mucosus (strain ATCC 35584 / DSM 2162 / JCM 9187 / O7/1) TaxID=765177 RepID=E8RAM3_DESM0|nr:50S ribosomal protein L32e [Desulfurococcus mucosus]ADV65459.1 LSU ribosomal protein L32E [Desulfurococcus mucosus DSM 2162]